MPPHSPTRTLVGALLALTLPAAAQPYVGLGVDFGAVLRRGPWSQTYGPALVTAARLEGATAGGWIGAVEGELLYGTDVRTDPIAALRTDLGLLGDDGGRAAPADVGLRARGFRLAALVGYGADFGEGPLGWRALVGPAYTVHNVRIQDDPSLTTSNLRDDYKRGYDRRAGGFGAFAEAGLTLADRGRRFVAFAVASANVFASRPLRSVQFDLRGRAPDPGTDTALGLRVGFVTALFRPASLEEAEDLYY